MMIFLVFLPRRHLVFYTQSVMRMYLAAALIDKDVFFLLLLLFQLMIQVCHKTISKCKPGVLFRLLTLHRFCLRDRNTATILSLSLYLDNNEDYYWIKCFVLAQQLGCEARFLNSKNAIALTLFVLDMCLVQQNCQEALLQQVLHQAGMVFFFKLIQDEIFESGQCAMPRR